MVTVSSSFTADAALDPGWFPENETRTRANRYAPVYVEVRTSVFRGECYGDIFPVEDRRCMSKEFGFTSSDVRVG